MLLLSSHGHEHASRRSERGPRISFFWVVSTRFKSSSSEPRDLDILFRNQNINRKTKRSTSNGLQPCFEMFKKKRKNVRLKEKCLNRSKGKSRVSLPRHDLAAGCSQLGVCDPGTSPRAPQQCQRCALPTSNKDATGGSWPYY